MVLQLVCIFMKEKEPIKIISLSILKGEDFVEPVTWLILFKIAIKELKVDLERQKFVNLPQTWIEKE